MLDRFLFRSVDQHSLFGVITLEDGKLEVDKCRDQHLQHKLHHRGILPLHCRESYPPAEDILPGEKDSVDIPIRRVYIVGRKMPVTEDEMVAFVM